MEIDIRDLYDDIYALYLNDEDFAECFNEYRRQHRIKPGHIFETFEFLFNELMDLDKTATLYNVQMTAMNFLYEKYK